MLGARTSRPHPVQGALFPISKTKVFALRAQRGRDVRVPSHQGFGMMPRILPFFFSGAFLVTAAGGTILSNGSTSGR